MGSTREMVRGVSTWEIVVVLWRAVQIEEEEQVQDRPARHLWRFPGRSQLHGPRVHVRPAQVQARGRLLCVRATSPPSPCADYGPRYYTKKKKAPIPTIVIGGNHEASNYLWELYVCSNDDGCVSNGSLATTAAGLRPTYTISAVLAACK